MYSRDYGWNLNNEAKPEIRYPDSPVSPAGCQFKTLKKKIKILFFLRF